MAIEQLGVFNVPNLLWCHYMAERLPIRRKTLSNQSINQSINQSPTVTRAEKTMHFHYMMYMVTPLHWKSLPRSNKII